MHEVMPVKPVSLEVNPHRERPHHENAIALRCGKTLIPWPPGMTFEDALIFWRETKVVTETEVRHDLERTQKAAEGLVANALIKGIIKAGNDNS